jgi:hypothetical protein
MTVFRDDVLAGKRAFITSGTSGINLAIAGTSRRSARRRRACHV